MRVGVAVVLLAACAAPPEAFIDDCPDPTPSAEVAEALAQLPTDGCEPGGFAGVDVQRVWITDTGQTFGIYPSKCGALVSTGDNYADATDDYLEHGYYLEIGMWSWGEATRLCRVQPDGSLWGHRFQLNFDGTSTVLDVVARPFGWIEGETQGEGLEKLSEWDGTPDDYWPSMRAMNVRVHEKIAYLISREGLLIIDVSNPRAPETLGWHPSRDDQYNDVKIVQKGSQLYAILGSNTIGTAIVNVTNPAAPHEVRRFNPNSALGTATHTLFTEDRADTTWVYFVDGSSPVLSVYDLEDPATPVAVSRYEGFEEFGEAGFHDLYVEGDLAYVNATTGGLALIDVSTPTVPRLVGRTLEDQTYSHSNWVTTAGGRKISVHGGEGYGSFVRIVDVDQSSPEFLETIGEFRLREEVSVHNIIAIGERAYVAYYQNGVRVLDLSDPTSPEQVAYYNTWDPTRARGQGFEGALGVDVDPVRGLVFVADSEAGLVILKLTD